MKKKTVKISVAVIASVVLLFLAFSVGVFVGTGGTLAGKFLGEYFKDENFVSAESSEIKITENVKNIDVEWVSGNVTVVPSEDEHIHLLEESAGGLSKSDALAYKIDGDTLEINFEKPEFGVFGINSAASKDLFLKLPEKYYDRISINSVSADVEIKNISANEIDIEVVSGEIEIQQTIFSDLDIESVSGNANIYLPENASFTTEIDSVSGDFNTDFEVTKQGDAYISGNGGMDISADMVSGDFGIYKKQ